MDEELTIWRPRHEIPVMERPERARKLRFNGFHVNKFIKQNPEVVIRALLAICAVAILVSCLVTRHNTEVELREAFAQELTAERIRTEQETIARIKDEYGINAQNEEIKLMEAQAKTVAKVLYAMRGNREAGLHLACWAVFNRVDNPRYSDEIYGVCSADQAFMGWSDNNDILTELYDIALEEVQRWHTGVRPMNSGYVMLYWSPNEIYLFDDLGHRFYESDWVKYIDSLK